MRPSSNVCIYVCIHVCMSPREECSLSLPQRIQLGLRVWGLGFREWVLPPTQRIQLAPNSPREECSIFNFAALRVGEPRMRQKRNVSSAAADTMVVPSGDCAMCRTRAWMHGVRFSLRFSLRFRVVCVCECVHTLYRENVRQ